MRSKFNLKEKGHPTPPTNVIQLQKGSAAPKIGSNEPYTEKLHQYAKKGIQFFSSKNHSGFFSSLTSEFAEKEPQFHGRFVTTFSLMFELTNGPAVWIIPCLSKGDAMS